VQLQRLQDQLHLVTTELNAAFLHERQRRKALEETVDRVEASRLAAVRTLAFVVEAKDAYTSGHLERTQRLALALTERVAPELLVDPEVGYGYLLHDVGKVGIPEAILCKPGPLTPAERQVMRTHPVLGVEVVGPMGVLTGALATIRSHHERWDGRGYPDGLRGEDIPLTARIFAVADTFDALTSERPYRQALDEARSAELIARGAGSQFDPVVVGAFLDLLEDQADGLDAPAAGR
jgi:HD-GYP domain-containing protein (c-di-GMP phosphodiesterase class II)